MGLAGNSTWSYAFECPRRLTLMAIVILVFKLLEIPSFLCSFIFVTT